MTSEPVAPPSPAHPAPTPETPVTEVTEVPEESRRLGPTQRYEEHMMTTIEPAPAISATSKRPDLIPVLDAMDRVTGSRSGEPLSITDPGNEEVLATVAASSDEEVRQVVARARAATPGWQQAEAADRAAILHRAASRIHERRELLAELQTLEGGKPIADSLGGVDAAASAVTQYAELGPLHRGRALQGSWNATDLMVHVPRGVAAVLVPWNDPIAVAAGLVAANLVVGNTVVLKPSEHTPLCSLALLDCFEDLPDGVLGAVVGGPAAGRALVEADIDLVVHTGSVATGRSIAASCAPRLLQAVLELGGKDALVVDAGVDPGWAADQAAVGAFTNAGQLCTSVERIYVHRDIAEPFVANLVDRAERLAPGHGLDPATQIGPLIDERQREHVHAQVTGAVEAGARLLTGGTVPDGPGTHYPPTVMVDVPADRGDLRTSGGGLHRRLVGRGAPAGVGFALRTRCRGVDGVAGPRPAGLAHAAGGDRQGQRHLRRRPRRRRRTARDQRHRLRLRPRAARRADPDAHRAPGTGAAPRDERARRSCPQQLITMPGAADRG